MDEERHLDLPGPVNFLERDRELVKAHGLISRHSSEIKPKELRLLLIGKTGDGKSATANTILEREEFESGLCAESITQKCQFGEVERNGRKFVVVDTPGLCDTTFPPEVIKRELIRSVGYASPGFHAIIFVLAAGKYTEECVRVRDQFFDWFGEDVSKHSLILITRGDEIKVEKRETYLQKVPKGLDEFMESCGRRVMFFNNRASGPESENQIKELIKKVDHIVDENEGRYFSNIAFRLARAYERMSSTPVYQWMVKKLEAIGTSEQTKRNSDQHQTSDDADSANLMSAGHDEVHASSSDSIDENDELLEEKMESFLEEQVTKCETEQRITTSHGRKPPEYMAEESKAEGTKLREQIKKTCVFEKFVYFFTGAYDKFVKKFLNKTKTITYKKH